MRQVSLDLVLRAQHFDSILKHPIQFPYFSNLCVFSPLILESSNAVFSIASVSPPRSPLSVSRRGQYILLIIIIKINNVVEFTDQVSGLLPWEIHLDSEVNAQNRMGRGFSLYGIKVEI
ncbi:uncharacterized protein G2W53_001049 [Senna tora]|uniref:Uncharacterized protein n=1 Tax=Senna tora TaxID=362788 RepID=A0A834XGW8_9FABA|nr:uncharacterized protein G2W53_001049 [Senna tora]